MKVTFYWQSLNVKLTGVLKIFTWDPYVFDGIVALDDFPLRSNAIRMFTFKYVRDIYRELSVCVTE